MDEETTKRLVAFLSRDRLQALIELTGSEADSIELHQDALSLGCEMMKVIATIEIALRNTVVANLNHHFGVENLFQHPTERLQWKEYEQDSINKAVRQVRRAVYAKLSQAEKAELDAQAYPDGRPAETTHSQRVRARQGRITVSEGRLVAELTLNFWKRLYGPRYEHALWRPTLKRTFPNPGLARGQIAAQLEIIYQSRNRLAHHEPVLHNRFTETVKAIRFVIRELQAHPDECDTPLSRLLRDDIDRVTRSGERLMDRLRAFKSREQ